MVQAFIFGASRVAQENSVSWLLAHPLLKGRNFLDWTIASLESSGIDKSHIHFIGGHEIEKVIANHPDIQYVVNPKWQNTHVLGSLRYALNNWNGGDILLMYGDTLFRNNVVAKLLEQDGSVVLGIDIDWQLRVTDKDAQAHAEKIVISDNEIQHIGREAISLTDAPVQFSGLTLIRAQVVSRIISALNDEQSLGSPTMKQQGSLSDLLRFLRHDGTVTFGWCNVSGNWAEIDLPTDLSRFVFGTKAETLERIQPFLRQSAVVSQLYFTIADWKHNTTQCIQTIAKEFKNQRIIIRSSSFLEDSWKTSAAGAFESVLDVDASDPIAIEKGVNQVVHSYMAFENSENFKANQVLVQPFITNVKLSGVAFTRQLESGAPYFVITYDDLTTRTNTVTSGTTNQLKTFTVSKMVAVDTLPFNLSKIVRALKELENVVAHTAIDVEFVLDNKDTLYIVQVRPIVLSETRRHDAAFAAVLQGAKSVIQNRMKQYPHLYGDTTILADMPDWNPAEMIGVRPQPLAISLYKYLITDSVWSAARAKIGYHHPPFEQLLYVIGGHPFIDVRNSFNNLIPAGLPSELANKLVNHYLAALANNASLHDKVEFEIAITCFTPDIDAHCERLYHAGFSVDEVATLKKGLKALTIAAITQEDHDINSLIKQTEQLEQFRDQILENRELKSFSISNTIRLLLQATIENGTIPFSILARYGFIASSWLKGLVAKGVLSENQKNDFLNSIETVAGELVNDMNGVNSGQLQLEVFLKKYGHLRPGTYDVNSFSYAERPDYYFNVQPKQHIAETSPREKTGLFTFDQETLEKVDAALVSMQMPFDSTVLLAFIEGAIKGREYAKFQFTKNVNAILQLVVEWGKGLACERGDMGYLWLDDLLQCDAVGVSSEMSMYIKQKIEQGKSWHESSLTIETPHFITKPDDLDVIYHRQSSPNFVTDKEIIGEVVFLGATPTAESLDGKIVLIEGADPGYDWIFLHEIKGLLTKYGGAGSHMTIRCAEFGLPAAIGCGSYWFEQLIQCNRVSLNCRNKQLTILS